jgi:hypothetical protein
MYLDSKIYLGTPSLPKYSAYKFFQSQTMQTLTKFIQKVTNN